ncbi:MAG: CvpA family protein [Rhizomicrobium sp.]
MHGPDSLWVDGAVAAVVIVSTVVAVLRGFVREVLSILAWTCAAVAAIWLGPRAALLLRAHVSTPFLAPVLAYAGIFLLVLIPLAFLSARVAWSVRQSPIGTVDRCLGVPFGIVRGLVIAGLAYLAVSLVVPFSEQPTWLTRARLMPVVKESSDVISSLLPNFGRAFTDRDDAPAIHVEHGARPLYQASDRRALDHLIARTSASGRP